MTWKHYFKHSPLMLTWKTLKTHIITINKSLSNLSDMVFISTHIHSRILQALLFYHHIFELSLDLHLKHNRLWPSLMNFAKLMLLNVPECNKSVSILIHPIDIPPSIRHMVFHYIPQLFRKAVSVLNVFKSEFDKMTS